MQLLNGPEDIITIVNANPGKKLGKFTINCNKISGGQLNFSEGHASCIETLRNATCEIVVLEFVNSHNMYSGYVDIPPPEIIDETSVLNLCISENVDAEYILYNSDDLGVDSTSVAQIVSSRMETEDYKNKLSIPDNIYNILETNFQFITSRNQPSQVILTRSYKTGSESLAIEHYINKYMSHELVRTDPKFFTGTYIPISSSIYIDDVSTETKDFADYFHQVEKSAVISDSTAVQADLELYATGLGYSTENFIVIDDSEFVGEDIFISIDFNGPYSSVMKMNRWL